jgi:hypothetical protein
MVKAYLTGKMQRKCGSRTRIRPGPVSLYKKPRPTGQNGVICRHFRCVCQSVEPSFDEYPALFCSREQNTAETLISNVEMLNKYEFSKTTMFKTVLVISKFEFGNCLGFSAWKLGFTTLFCLLVKTGRGSTIQIEGFDPGSERTLAAWLRHASQTDH